MNYDTMSFRELVQETINHSCHDLLMPPDDWLDMMRRAVIREASVGEIVIEQHEGYLSPEPIFTVGTKSKLKAGTFYIVPKETHEGT